MGVFRSHSRRDSTSGDVLSTAWWEPPGSPAGPSAADEPPPSAALRPDGDVHVLFLRAFLAFGWFRTSIEKVIDPEWWNGNEVRVFLTGGADARPMAGFDSVIEHMLLPLAAPISWIVVVLQLTVAVGVLTAIRFDAALGAGAALGALFILSGQINPAAFYIIIHVSLIGSPAGRRFTLGAVRGPDVRRWGPWAIGGCLTLGTIAYVSGAPFGLSSVDDPAAVLSFLCVFTAGVVVTLWRRAERAFARRHTSPPRTSDDGADAHRRRRPLLRRS